MLLQELISRQAPCPGSHTSRSYVFAAPNPVSPAHRFRALCHAFMFGVARIGMRDADQFYLAELMLAHHAPRIAPGGAGFASKTIRQGGEPQR